MRVFISVDMEGVAGIVSESQRNADRQDYAWARQIMIEEANAAVAGAFDAGAREVWVNDSHDTMDNMIPDRLDRRARLVTGTFKPLSMMQGISKRFDAAMFIGYHARRGTAGAVMDHTYSERGIDTICINGIEAGETLINGLVAGAYGVPLVLVSGDQMLQREVQALDPKIRSVIVKEGITRYSAVTDHPEAAREKIRAAVQETLEASRWPKPLRLRSPYRFEINFPHSHQADICLRVPGVKRKSGRRIVFRQEDYLTGFKELLALMSFRF